MSNEVDRTLWVGNLSEKVTEELLYELFLQAGPLEKVFIPKEKDGRQKQFAFVTFSHDVSVPYTIQMMDSVPLFGRTLRLQSRPGSVHQKQQQVQGQGQFMSPDRRTGAINIPQNVTPVNPYSVNQPMANMGNVQQPQFQRSHTWHGNEQGIVNREMDRDYNERGRDRDRGHYRSRDSRDRSGSQHRDQDRDSHSRSPNPHTVRVSGQEDFETRRHNVLQRHERAMQHYRRNPGSKHHHHKY